ncbi:actin-binding WH2 domain-containing protein [Acidobacteriota bacterium]
MKGSDFARDLVRNQEQIFENILESKHLEAQMRYFATMGALFAALYGLCCGFYAAHLQILFAAIKVPLLLFGTMAICLPTLYTFNLLLGSKLSFKQTLAVLLMSNYLLCLVLVSFAPILLFFILSTSSKSFAILLNVAIFTISGLFGVSLLWKAMQFLSERSGDTDKAVIIKVWSVIYMFVGTQMAWLLRPFIGEKDAVILFREIEGNFYVAVFHSFLDLFK